MSDSDEMKKLIDKVHAQQSVIDLRKLAWDLVVALKSIGLEREEAIAYLAIPFHDSPAMLPLMRYEVRRYWRKA